MKPARKKICRECPFRRIAPRGYLGAASGPWDLIEYHLLTDSPFVCHMKVNWEKMRGQPPEAIVEHHPQCRGYLTMLRNSSLIPIRPDLGEAVQSVPVDRETVFASIREFVDYHEGRASSPLPSFSDDM